MTFETSEAVEVYLANLPVPPVEPWEFGVAADRPLRRLVAARPVQSSEDIERVRLLRNASLDGMTKNAYPTRTGEQARYWAENKDRLQAWLYLAFPDGDPFGRQIVVGYASLRRAEDGKLWSFMAVAPEYRGQGYGRAIQRHHVRQTDEDVYDEILETNTACLEMTRKSGDWRVIDRRGGLVYQLSEAGMRT